MTGVFRPHTPARRDAAVRRLRTVNRSLIGLAVLSGAVLTDVAANAFPGRTIKTVAGTPTTATRSPTSTPAVSATKRRPRSHTTVAALTPPASPPVSTSSGSSSTGSQASTGSASVDSTPAPAPVTVAPAAPGPVVSGGS